MEKYYKDIKDGYIITLSTGCGHIEITEDEYNLILTTIQNKPTAEEGYDYKLKEDLTWELYELPYVPPVEEDATEEDYQNALARFGI